MTDDSLRELATQLPYDRPGVERTESVRASLLAAASVPAQPGPRRWLLVGGGFAAGALAAAALAVLLLRSPSSTSLSSPPREAYARIESSSAAAVEHTLAATPSGGTDEIVRVHAGTLHLAVPAPRVGDRVRIATSDAEIEGAGEYEVVVAAETLARVTVSKGSATVRLVGKQDAVFLAAGQTWRASIQTADLTPVIPSRGGTTASGAPLETSLDGASVAALPISPAPAALPPPSTGPTSQKGAPIAKTLDGTSGAPRAATATAPRTAPSPRTAGSTPASTSANGPIETELAPPPRPAVTAPPQQLTAEASPPPAPASPGSEVERHFRAGWSLLRANKLAEAVIELRAAADAGDSPLAVDARYYQAIALVKAKRGPEAERALVQFLDHAPTSTRRGRAAMMLGRLLADRGDAKTARDWFEVAAQDPDATVAAAAKAALAPR